MKKNYFFCGVGGSGMSSIAQILAYEGNSVAGSDRSLDNGQSKEKFDIIARQGINLFPQNGSGINEKTDILVVSSAIEETIPDVKKALETGVTIKKRSEILAEIFHSYKGIAIGGTSGKSTVTGMTGHIFNECKKSPTVINGAVMLNAGQEGLGNCYAGKGEHCIIEADESDGSIKLYSPEISVVTNITLDHKPLEELRSLFSDFIAKAKTGAVINLDCPETAAFKAKNSQTVTFSIKDSNADVFAENITPLANGVSFAVNGIEALLSTPGKHNVANALAAISAAELAGINIKESVEALKSFRGIHRRMETVGTKNGVTVIDDFAHNPDKIAASLSTLKEHDGRIFIVYQPHGFGPTKFLRKGLVQSFAEGLGNKDFLLMPEIFYAGGTADKSISSNDIINDVKAAGKNALFLENRINIKEFLIKEAKKGDRIVIMGARDDTLTTYAEEILQSMEETCR